MKYLAVTALLFASVLAIPTGGDTEPTEPTEPTYTTEPATEPTYTTEPATEPTEPAEPTDPTGPYEPCPDGLFSNAQCCATDVLGVIGLDCDVPSAVPGSPEDFSATCAEIGQQAKCCVLPVAEQDVLCQSPVGV